MQKLKSMLPQLLRVALTVAAIYLLFTQLNTRSLFAILQNAKLGYLILGAALFQLATLIRAIRWMLLMRDAAVPVRPLTAIALTHISEFVATALPVSYAGDAIRILELEGQHSKAEITGVSVLDRLIGMTTLMSVSLIALLLGHTLLPIPVALPMGVLAAVSLIGMIALANPHLQRGIYRLVPRRFAPMLDRSGARFYQGIMQRSPRVLLTALILSLANVVVTVLVHYVTALALLPNPLTLGHFFIFAPVVNLSLLFPTVGGLGIREVGYALILAPFGISAERGVALGLGIYLTRLWVALIGALLWMRLALRPRQAQ